MLLFVYLLFGPLLLILSVLALTHFAQALLFDCDPVDGWHASER